MDRYNTGAGREGTYASKYKGANALDIRLCWVPSPTRRIRSPSGGKAADITVLALGVTVEVEVTVRVVVLVGVIVWVGVGDLETAGVGEGIV